MDHQHACMLNKPDNEVQPYLPLPCLPTIPTAHPTPLLVQPFFMTSRTLIVTWRCMPLINTLTGALNLSNSPAGCHCRSTWAQPPRCRPHPAATTPKHRNQVGPCMQRSRTNSWDATNSVCPPCPAPPAVATQCKMLVSCKGSTKEQKQCTAYLSLALV